MAETRRGVWAALAGGAIVVGLSAALLWFTDDPSSLSSPPPAAGGAAAPSDDEGATVAPAAALPGPSHRIPSGGRLRISGDDLPASGPLPIALDLPDIARGDGAREVIIACENGQRIETKTRALPGAGSGVRLDLPQSVVGVGRCMIQVDTEDPDHFQMRRYVIDTR